MMISPSSMTLPVSQRIHFVGVGGIGMSALAELLVDQGYSVTGSDMISNDNVQRLIRKGVKVFEGHHASQVHQVDLVVLSSAIAPDNSEVREARHRGISVIHRSEMLAHMVQGRPCVAVSGTHGKTTTTSLVGALLDQASLDPTIVNGGILQAYGSNVRSGKGNWWVVEADESDGSLLNLHPHIGILTNIDPEHLEFYGSFEALQSTFVQFLRACQKVCVVCMDHPVVRELVHQVVPPFPLLTYGLCEEAQVRADNVRYDPEGTSFDLVIQGVARGERIFVPLLGPHNVQNALAAIAVAWHLGVSLGTIREGLAQFQGVDRRFTLKGTIKGVRIIDDYAHHPVEIHRVIQAGRQAIQTEGRLRVVMQPHRYSRLHSLLEEFVSCFGDADEVWLTPIYTAGEKPIAGLSSEHLAEKIRERFTHMKVKCVQDPDQLVKELSPRLQSKDMVLFMGAGTITQWAGEFPKKWQDFENQKYEVKRAC